MRRSLVFCHPVVFRLPRVPVAGIGTLAMLVLGTVLCECRLGSVVAAAQTANSNTVLSFPTDRAVGVVYSRPAVPTGYGYGVDYYSNWQPIGPARGELQQPLGHDIRLNISNAASTDLAFLEQLDPAAIDALWLRGSNVNDDQLKHVGQLTGLRFLQLGQARISDQGVHHLRNLRNLQYLGVSAFAVHRDGFGVGDEGMAVVANLPALESISLRLTQVTNLGLINLVKCKSLRSVSLEGTKVTDLGLKLLSKLPNLQSLSLGVYDEGANVTDKGLPAVGRLSQLRSLRLSGTPITDDGLAHLADLNKLEHLSIDNTQVTNAGLRHLAGLKSLKQLRAYNLADGDINDEGARHLGPILSLERIVARLSLTDKGVAQIAKLPRLQSIQLDGDGGRVTNHAIRSLAGHPTLKRVSLSDCAITYDALAHMKTIPNLEDLSISRSGLDARGLVHLKEMPALRFLRLHFGRESDRRSQMQLSLEPLRQLRQIHWLDLSGEGISGEQLEPISGLTQLEHLDINDIILDDASASHLSRLTTLTDFRLNESRITDRGLSFLSDMKKLQHLTIPCLVTDDGLKSIKELQSLRMLQIASPYITKNGLAELSAAIPSLQEVNHFEYRQGGEAVTASKKDSFWREGTLQERPAKDALEDAPAPELTVGDWILPDGAEVIAPNFHGKVVLVDFFGMWSRRWHTKLPELRELYDKYHDDGLEILGVHTTARSGGLQDFLKQERIRWPVAIDVEERTTTLWQVDSYPDFFLIDRNGKLRYADIFDGHVEAAIKLLLSEGTAR